MKLQTKHFKHIEINVWIWAEKQDILDDHEIYIGRNYLANAFLYAHNSKYLKVFYFILFYEAYFLGIF